MVSLLAALTLVLGGCALPFADSGNGYPPVPNGLLYDESVSGGSSIVTVDFTASTDHDIHVYFKNEGSGATTVTLQKKGFLGRWSDVAISGTKDKSFSVPAGSEDFQIYDGSSRTTYRVELATPTGSDIYGRLRVNQQ